MQTVVQRATLCKFNYNAHVVAFHVSTQEANYVRVRQLTEALQAEHELCEGETAD